MDTEEEILMESEDSVDYLVRGQTFVMNYAWFLIAGVIIIGIFWKKIHKRLDRWYENIESRRYAAKYHKNPDLALERLEALQLSRKRMQEELDKKSQEFAEKKQEREKQKTLEKIARAEAQSRGASCSEESSQSEYNPLMGDTSRGYRPPRKSGCRGGGCG